MSWAWEWGRKFRGEASGAPRGGRMRNAAAGSEIMEAKMIGRAKHGMRKEVGHGGIVPRGWRMGWYEPRRRVGVYFPRPLHWILRAARECAYRARLAWSAPGRECAEVFAMQRKHRERQLLADEYARGYMAGWRECFAACLEAVQEEMARTNDGWDAGAMLLPEIEGKGKTRKN